MVLIILRSITLVAAIVWLANGFWNGQALLVTYVYGSVGLFVLVALLLSVFDIPFPVLYRHGFLGQPGECIHAAVVSANARRTTAGARKPSRSINHCWL